MRIFVVATAQRPATYALSGWQRCELAFAEKEWVPVTKLGRLVKDGKIPTIEDIYLHSLPIKEFQIIDNFFVGGTLKDEVMKIHPVQKMSSAGQTNRFVRFVPAPRGSGVVGSPTMKKMLAFAGVADCFTCSCGHTRTKGNFMKATFEALRATYAYLTPDLWKPTYFTKPPYQEWSDHLSQSKPTVAY